MKKPRFAHLVLKPTLACTARCNTCSTRKSLHQAKLQEKQLGLSDWKNLFSEAHVLGLNKLTISGGEPTLYKDLSGLIEEGKRYGWELGLNTNGSRITPAFAMRLLKAGLNIASISLYSDQPAFHDSVRNHPGLWQKAIDGIKSFATLRETVDPSFRVNMQTILCKDNFRQFPELIRLAYQLKVCGITFSYLEGDFKERRYLLDENEIAAFKNEIVPDAVDIIQASSHDVWAKRMAVAAVRSIYPDGKISRQDYAKGIYRTATPCTIPSFFSIILANGDVHPCCMIEYSHEPVIGNLQDNSFRNLWQGKTWVNFRQKGFDLCRFCPVPEQVYIPIMRRPEIAPVQYFVKNTFLRSWYMPLKQMVFSRRNLLRFIRTNR